MGKTSAFLKHLGMEILDLQPGRSLIRLPVGAHLKNSSGGMHGGAIASLIDSAGGLAARTLTHPVTVATVEFKVNFLAPSDTGRCWPRDASFTGAGGSQWRRWRFAMKRIARWRAGW